MINKRLINTGVAAAAAAVDPLQNFETVTYTGNGGTQKITGYIRKGAAFSTNSTYVSLPSNFNLANNSFTISAWFANTKTSGNGYGITSSGSGTSCHTNLHIGRRGSNGKFTFAFFCSDLDSSTNISTDGTWQHWVCTYDASTNSRKIYLNGTLDASDTASNDYIGTANLQLGGDTYWGTGNEYKGKLDQVRIFNKALSSSEVTTLYGETYASSTKSTTDIFGDGSGVALYELDDSADDTGVAIDSGQSGNFNGSSSKIDLPVLGLGGASTRSVSAWIKTTDNSTTQFIFGSGTQASYQVFAIHLSPTGKVSVSYSASQLDTTSTPINNNQWHHIAVTFSGGSTANTTLYVDGVSQTLTEIGTSGTVNTGNQNYAIGYNSPNPSYPFYFNGQIDDVRIYSDVLTSTEIGYLYNNTTASIPTDNFVSYYKLDGNANDTQGSNDGTWSGTESYSTPALLTQYNGTATNVNYLGMAFQPDLVWIKKRNLSELHALTDSVRGVNSILGSNDTWAESTFDASWRGLYGQVTSFDTNGFSVDVGTNTSVSPFNVNGDSYVAWCWKAGGTAVSNTDGSITSSVSANQDAGFSIVKWTSTSSNGTIGHGLSATPELYILKTLQTGTDNNWYVYTTVIDGSLDYLTLNTTNAKGNSGASLPTSSVFTFGGETVDMIAYCFHSVDSYQKVGSYTGTGASGNTITTGFRPRFILLRRSNTANNWDIFDSTRDSSTYVSKTLKANSSDAESTYPQGIYFQDNGFEPENTYFNDSGDTIIYLAIA